MNSLASSVSLIKLSANLKKNSELQVTVLKLPTKYEHLSRGEQQHFGAEATDHILTFQNAQTLDHQLAAVKGLYELLQTIENAETLEPIIQFLSDTYFMAPLKHPVRNTISKMFQKGEKHHPLIVTSLADTLIGSINSASKHEADAIYSINNLICSVGGCFENVPIAQVALRQCRVAIVEILKYAIELYVLEISKPNSPAKKSEYFIFLHTAVRIALLCLQQNRGETIGGDFVANVEAIAEICLSLIKIDDVPMDTKLNCGIFVEGSRTNGLNGDKHEITRLCLAYGTINTIFDNVNVDFTILGEVVSDLMAIANNNLIEQSILLGVGRSYLQLIKNLLLFRYNDVRPNEQFEIITTVCLNYFWTFAAHHIDSVRHLCKDLLKNLLKLSTKHEHFFGLVIEKNLQISQKIDKSDPENNVIPCLTLTYLCQTIGTERILLQQPTLPTLLLPFLGEPMWATCYEKLMIANSKAIKDLPVWHARWIQPLLLHAAQNNYNLQLYENLISAAIKTRPDIAKCIIEEADTLPIEIYLFVMWTIRKNGLVNSIAPSWTPALDAKICGAKFHINDDTRIMHLRILVEVHKSTELFTEAELAEVLLFLEYNCNCQSPSMRQKICSFMTKMFLRIDATYAWSILGGQFIAGSGNLNEFLEKLKHLCVSNLSEGANFSRRSISLNLLLQIVKFHDKLKTSDYFWDKLVHETLIRTLDDSYESNKDYVNEIIRYCPKNLLPKTNHFELDRLKQLATSVQSSDSISAAYCIEFFCIIKKHFSDIFDAILWCESELQKGIEVARQSLLIAASVNPLYGLLFCIRHLVSKVEFKSLTEEEERKWRQFTQRFIKTCKELTTIAAPIVNSDSPEGHFPNDFSEISHYLTTNDDNESITTPQMVLLCAWRTVKEVSLFLGDIVLRASICDATKGLGLITVEEIQEIGTHFHELLSETKHRGAFEQAYVGFSKLCVRLWRSDIQQLHEMPMAWLTELLNIISVGANQPEVADKINLNRIKFNKVCATRRSAGVPFMIQAIITAELQVCSTNSLHLCMRKLLDLCRDESAAAAEARTHALNILRALFRCTELGDDVGTYISDGFQCSIGGYKATTWPERNSATLLFAALITRVFGVQRTRDSENLNIRNKMTGQTFFMRYPRLFDFFYAELKASNVAIANDRRPSTLQPLLLVFSRLYPSSFEGCASSLYLNVFLPLIANCTKSSEMKTRKLAVKSYVALMEAQQVFMRMGQVYHELGTSITNPKRNSNSIHGILLQLFYLVKCLKQPIDQQQLTLFCSDILKLSDLISFSNNFVLIQVFSDILIECLKRLKETARKLLETNKILPKFVAPILHCSSSHFLGLPQAQKSCLVLKLIFNEITPQKGVLDNIFEICPSKQSYEIIDSVLNILTMILFTSDDQWENLIDEFECTQNEINFVKLLSKKRTEELACQFKNKDSLKIGLMELVNDQRFYPFGTVKACTVLSKLDYSEKWSSDQLTDMLDCFETELDEIKNAKLRLFTAYLSKHSLIEMDANGFLERFMDCLRSMAEPHCIEQLRLTTSICICNISKLWHQQKSTIALSQRALVSYAATILNLLRDDTFDIRTIVLTHVGELTQTKGDDGQSKGAAIVITALAEERFLDWLNDRFVAADLAEAWQCWRKLIAIQLDRLDRTETNMFGETINVCRKAMQKLANCLRAINEPNSDEIIRNLYEEFKL